MADGNYIYTKASVNQRKLTLEIEAETFSQVLEKMHNDETGTDNLLIKFAADLTGPEVTTLGTIVTNHDGNPPNHYDYFCFCCGLNFNEYALSTPTECQCCSSMDIQAQYHKCNLIATTDPTVDDDITEGYDEGSVWINKSTNNIFQCVDNTDGAAVWIKLTPSEHDYIENFDKPVNFWGNPTIPALVSGHLYGTDLILYHASKADETIAGKLRYDLASADSCDHVLTKFLNPADHTYYEIRWKEQSENATDIRMAHWLTDLELYNYYVNVAWKNATTITIEVSDDGGTSTASEDVVTDITDDQEYCIRIKNGEIQFLIDDVVKATFDGGDPIFHDVLVGIGMEIGWLNGHVSDDRWVTWDYIKLLPGRTF